MYEGDLFAYEYYQLYRQLKKSNIILNGPPLSGKRKAIERFFIGSKYKHIIIDLRFFNESLSKTSATISQKVREMENNYKKKFPNEDSDEFIDDLLQDKSFDSITKYYKWAEGGVPFGAITSINVSTHVRTGDARDFLWSLPEGTYVVFEYADMLPHIKHPYEEYVFEVIEDLMESDDYHVIFAPVSTNYFMKIFDENFHTNNYTTIDFTPASPNDIQRFFGVIDSNAFKLYELTGGLKGALYTYFDNPEKFINNIETYVLLMFHYMYNDDNLSFYFSELLPYYRRAGKISRDTLYKVLEINRRDYPHPRDHPIINALMDLELLYERNDNYHILKPFHLYNYKGKLFDKT